MAVKGAGSMVQDVFQHFDQKFWDFSKNFCATFFQKKFDNVGILW
jgi:hypothetical protein